MTDVCGIKCSKIFIADCQILGAALLFGIGFIGQRAVSVEGLGPMTCNAMRFGLSAILLMIIKPWIPHSIPEPIADEDHDDFVKVAGTGEKDKTVDSQYVLTQLFGPAAASRLDNAKKTVLFWGIFLGAINFLASGFQQWGITMTSASKVAFIAGFDLFLTPIFSLFLPTLKHNGKPTMTTWIAVCLSVLGLFFLSDLTLNDLEIGRGETLTLVSTVFWTMHIMFTDVATTHIDAIHMMIVQMFVVTMFSGIAALILEPQLWFLHHLMQFLPWLLFLALTEGMAFMLMALGQAYAPPTHAAMILSLEGVFAAVASYFYLGEHLTPWELFGCALMLIATLLAEVGCSCFTDRGNKNTAGLITSSIVEHDSSNVSIADDLRNLANNFCSVLSFLATVPYVRVRDMWGKYKKVPTKPEDNASFA